MFEAPYVPYDPTDTAGFSVIDRIHRISHDLCLEMMATDDATEKESLKLRIDEAKGIIEQISRLKYEMGRNYSMQPIGDDGEPADVYNSELQRLKDAGKNTWFTAPWLFAEYRLLRSFFVGTTQWSKFDPFLSQKTDTFKQSGKSIHQIAATMQQFHDEHAKLESDSEKLSVYSRNDTDVFMDLSLLTHLSSADIEHLQSVGKAAQASRQEFILRDDQEKVWSHVNDMRHDALKTWSRDGKNASTKASLCVCSFWNSTGGRFRCGCGTGAILDLAAAVLGHADTRAKTLGEPPRQRPCHFQSKIPILGSAAGSFPLLSLRTNKADVVVGVDREVAERLDGSGSKWRVDGKCVLFDSDFRH
ncbi:hypothetical protein B0H10DRAFT_2027309 [Mycena sp. CBHHK59/15]|nr:hypothetical protein B0H10DRAFT_2027309 [Mycena sp. CBHHK59/15]